MHLLVTGAGGFVGQALVRRLLVEQPRLTRLTLVDTQLQAAPQTDPRVVALKGDFADPALLEAALEPAPDAVFHLASVPGSRAEAEPELGLRVNLMASMALLRALAERGSVGGSVGASVGGSVGASMGARMGPPPRVVFASSVAVYGALPPEGSVDESTPPQPALSYGAHKLMTEVLLADYSRRGLLDGVSLRLPGIVARPASPSGHGSAFMSDIIRRLCAGQAYECPVSATAQAWWMSLPCCVSNLLHALAVPGAALGPSRVVQLPVITATLAELVASIEALRGQPATLSWRPDERIEALFGRLPRLNTPNSRSLGFVDDGNLRQLVQQALADS